MAMEFDVYAKNCPTRLILDRLSNKWSMLIMDRLGKERVRFNQLRRDIEGISQKVLSQTLKNLERDGLVRRKVFPTVPVTVEYSITDLGLTLTKTVNVITHWAEKHGDRILTAQKKYDSTMKSARIEH